MAEKPKQKPPIGGRKGGTIFPHLTLSKAEEYAKKLVSKTHTGPQPANIILPGVLGSSGGGGQVKASAMKQYHLMEGLAKEYSATSLAKALVIAPPEEKPQLLVRAFLGAKIFKTLFDTFHGDSVSPAKLKQQASAEKVHPDSVDECVRLFTEGAVYSGLGNLNGDTLQLKSSSELSSDGGKDGESEGQDNSEDNVSSAPNGGDNKPKSSKDIAPGGGLSSIERRNPRSPFNVDIKIDSSMDPDKLEKLIKILHQYGAY